MNATAVLAQEHAVDVGETVAFYRHGWHSWSPTVWVDPDARRHPISDLGRRLGHDDPAHAFDVRMGGSSVGAVQHRDGAVTLLGALTPGAWVRPEPSQLRGSGESPTTEWFVASGDEADVFAGYARALADRLGRRGGTRMRVWCSWYSYYESVTETAMSEVIDGLGELQFDIVQVDDGWQRAVGDWDANDDFPGGMAAIAERIGESGRRAGLWLAPLIAQSTSALAAERPELLLRSEDGEPVAAGINWGSTYFALDPTTPATHEFLSQLISTVRGWGYDYLKLDFLYAGAYPGVPRREMPREVAYREAMEVVRAAAGDDCYLLASGAPIVASVGVFDGIRIGPDVAEFWEDPAMVKIGDESGRGARNAIATSCQRLWLRPAIDTDPDVVFFRDEGVELDQRTLGTLRDLGQIAGFLGVSDPPGQLSDEAKCSLRHWLTDDPPILHESRYVWRIGEREVDFSWVFPGPVPAGSGDRT